MILAILRRRSLRRDAEVWLQAGKAADAASIAASISKKNSAREDVKINGFLYL